MKTRDGGDSRYAWFLEDRVGLFVHWGMYSAMGLGEQIVWRDLMPQSEYAPYAADFKPPKDWARRLTRRAAEAGMRYIVLTTRHHDGYCLFGTDTHKFNAVDTGPGRDLVAEYVEAARESGLKVGFYFSLLTWRWPAFWSPKRHPEELPRMVEEAHS